jgi:hypothetical protein
MRKIIATKRMTKPYWWRPGGFGVRAGRSRKRIADPSRGGWVEDRQGDIEEDEGAPHEDAGQRDLRCDDDVDDDRPDDREEIAGQRPAIMTRPAADGRGGWLGIGSAGPAEEEAAEQADTTRNSPPNGSKWTDETSAGRTSGVASPSR